MKFITYKPVDSLADYRTGFIIENQIFDLSETYQALLVSEGEMELAYSAHTLCPADPRSFFALGQIGFNRAIEADQFARTKNGSNPHYLREQIKLGPPVIHPEKIICIGTNYRDHVAEMKTVLPSHPVLFAKFANALTGPEDAIEKSPMTNKLDYEVELAVVMGREAKDVPENEALQYVAGYTIANDVSARDLQKRTAQWLQGKTLDRSTPIGPWIVTADELGDPGNLALSSKVNGELRQSSSTKELIFSVPYLISFISKLMTLSPGDIILTGTPDGVGFAQDPPAFLKPGDQVCLNIEGIGTLQNKVETINSP